MADEERPSHSNDADSRSENTPDESQQTRFDDAGEMSPYDDLVAKLIEREGPINVSALADAVELQEAADAADSLEQLDEDEAADVLVEMDAQPAADALAEMEMPLAVLVIDDLVDEGEFAYAAKLLQLMASDDAVDLLQAMDEEHRERLLREIPSTQSAKLRRLIRYSPETAGGIMTTDFIVLRDDMTVAQATDVVRTQDVPDEVQYLPVIDDEQRLAGVVSLRDLLVHKPHERVGNFMEREVDTLRPEMDREAVAHEFDRYDYAIMPVVDEENRLLGIVTVDDVIDVISKETTEDFQRFGGAGVLGVSLREAGIVLLVRKRIPWLLALVFVNVISGAGIAAFEGTIHAMIALVFFLPLLVGSGGNAGAQSATLMVRALATGDVAMRDWLRMLRKELLVAVTLGVIMSLAVSLVSTLRAPEIAVVVAVTMVLIVVVGSLIGMLLPFVLTKLKLDPATASAPLVTSLADITGVLIYLSIASWYLRVGAT